MKRNIVLGSVALTIIVVAVVYSTRPMSDKSISTTLVGTWGADDLSNGALHKRSEGVESETVTFFPDGQLLYAVTYEEGPRETRTEHWGWQVRRGRLLLRFIGEGSTEEWMPPIKVTASDTKLTLYRKNYPDKVFTRMETTDSLSSGPA